MAELDMKHIMTEQEVQEKFAKFKEEEDKKREDEAFQYKLEHMKELYAFEQNLRNQAKDEELKLQDEIDKAKKAIDIRYEAEVAQVKAQYASNSKKQDAELAKLQKQKEKDEKIVANRIKQETALQKEKSKFEKARQLIANKELTYQEKVAELMKDGKMTEEEAKKTLKKEGAKETKDKALEKLANYISQMNSSINEIAVAKGSIDTRLQGSKNVTKNGSYWDQMTKDITNNIGMSALVKQSDVTANIKDMVSKGIAFNVEERAFLQTVKSKIADTFDANDGTLRRLIRIQQEDTTASRLGMESALTSFLNNMYETTEYMTEQAEQIRSSISEASALMGGKKATEFEYQVQKWMGSLYSVGFSNTQGLSSALGKLAAGDISALTGDGYGNLLITAANQAGLSIADLLADGLDDSSTNQLMEAMVNYLGGIYSETKGSNVIAQQMAGVYGLTASDLKAAANLKRSTSTIAGNGLSNAGMMAQLNNMANSMWQRTSMGEMLENAKGNLQTTIAAGVANNPALYAAYTLGGMIDDLAGGLEFALPMVMGTGSAQTFNVGKIMQAGALGGGLLSGVGSLVSSLSAMGSSGYGSSLLKSFGVGSGSATVSRGNGSGLLNTGVTTSTSSSGYVGNSDGGDVQSKTMTDTMDSTKSQTAEAVDESEETDLDTVNTSITSIYNLLSDVIIGTKSFKVDMGNESAWSMAIGSRPS